MIIFYNKKTGRIVGTIDGRIHSKAHLKMWVGKKEETERIIVNWEPYQFFDEKGKKIDKTKLKKNKNYNADFEPKHPQKELMRELDKSPRNLNNYEVDLKTKELKKKN